MRSRKNISFGLFRDLINLLEKMLYMLSYQRDKIHVKRRITLKTFLERKGLPKAAPYAFTTERQDSRKANTLKTFLERNGIVKRNQLS